MQPVSDTSRFKVNPLPKWAVPLELIEWQPVYHQRGAEGEKGKKGMEQSEVPHEGALHWIVALSYIKTFSLVHN